MPLTPTCVSATRTYHGAERRSTPVLERQQIVSTGERLQPSGENRTFVGSQAAQRSNPVPHLIEKKILLLLRSSKLRDIDQHV
jgi:hypothetical protein